MRRLRLLLALAATGSIVAGGVGSSVEAAKPVKSCGLSSAGGGWAASRPHFPSGSQQVMQAVSVPYAPGRIFAANGASVVRTDDLGCTWKQLVTQAPPQEAVLPVAVPQPLDGVLRIPATLTITDISAPSSATQSSEFYVGGTDSTALGDEPVVYAMDPNGQLLERSSGLPHRGTLEEVTASSSAPNVVYAVVGGNDPTGAPGLYVSSDNGRTWTQKPASTVGLSQFRGDPVVPTTSFALRTGSGLVVTHDAGQSGFVSAGRPGGDVASYDVVSGGGGARIVQGHSTAARVDRSDDGGVSWASVPTPVKAVRVALQPLLDNIAVSDGHRLFLQSGDRVSHAQDITPAAGVPQDLQFSAPSATGYLVTGHLGNNVLIRGFAVDGRTLNPDQLQKVVLSLHGPPHQFPATLTPPTTNLTLRPGTHQDVPYQLLLPRTPSPVDLMFLIDTTASMQPTINGLRQDLAIIVNDVAATGLDARFGVAEFRDYPPGVRDMGAGEIGDKPYTLRRRVGLDDAGLQHALNQLKAAGGGDPPEADLTALLQSTTGQGQVEAGKVVISPGQDAGYRTGSLRLAVLATDEPFHRERYYLTPQWGTVVAALRAHNVYPIGLAVQSTNDSPTPQFDSMHDEQSMAAETGSIAPRGGVDCNGDLVPDIAAGQPFVCKVPIEKTSTSIGSIKLNEKTLPVKLAPAIVNAAENLPDLRAVGLALNGDHRVASIVTPAPVLNLRNDNTVGYTVRFACPRTRLRHVYHFGISANDGTRSLVGAAATVTCDALAPLPHTKPILPAAAAIVPPAAVAAAPPAPGNPLPNANPNPNPVPNANVGFASQQEEQKQLAFADADAGAALDESTEMQMSGLGGDGPDPAPWLFGAAGVLLTAATAYAARTRLSAAWHTSSR